MPHALEVMWQCWVLEETRRSPTDGRVRGGPSAERTAEALQVSGSSGFQPSWSAPVPSSPRTLLGLEVALHAVQTCFSSTELVLFFPHLVFCPTVKTRSCVCVRHAVPAPPLPL